MATASNDDAIDDGLNRLRRQVIADTDVPVALREALAAGAALEEIRLDAAGRWWHQGERFSHPRLIALFSRSLVCTARGTWLVQVEPYSYPVAVDDVGFFVTGARPDGDGWLLRLSDGSEERLDPATLRSDGDTWLGCLVHAGHDEARIVDGAWIGLAEAIDDGDEGGWRLRRGADSWPIGARAPFRRCALPE